MPLELTVRRHHFLVLDRRTVCDLPLRLFYRADDAIAFVAAVLRAPTKEIEGVIRRAEKLLAQDDPGERIGLAVVRLNDQGEPIRITNNTRNPPHLFFTEETCPTPRPTSRGKKSSRVKD